MITPTLVMGGAWSDAVVEWTAARLPDVGPGGFVRAVGIGVVLGSRPIAGVVYSNWNGANIEMSIYSEDPRWCTRGTLAAFFGYPFIQLGARRATATTASRNTPARDMLIRLGFVEEAVLRHALPDDDAVLHGMLAGDCRWLRPADVMGRKAA